MRLSKNSKKMKKLKKKNITLVQVNSNEFFLRLNYHLSNHNGENYYFSINELPHINHIGFSPILHFKKNFIRAIENLK